MGLLTFLQFWICRNWLISKAIERKDIPLLVKIFDHGTNIFPVSREGVLPEWSFNEQRYEPNSRCGSWLQIAAHEGDTVMLDLFFSLVKKRPKIIEVPCPYDGSGNKKIIDSALYYALSGSQFVIARRLIDVGAHSLPLDGHLYAAIDSGQPDAIALIFELGKENPSYLLEWGIKNSRTDAVKLLLDHGVTWEMRSTRTRAIEFAASLGRVECVRLLVEHGYDLYEGKDKPIVIASKNGHIEVVKALVEYGVSPSSAAINAATINRHFQVARFLLSRGAEMSSYQLKEAVDKDNDAVVAFYLDNGGGAHARIITTEIPDNDHYPLFHLSLIEWANRCNAKKVILLLQSRGISGNETRRQD